MDPDQTAQRIERRLDPENQFSTPYPVIGSGGWPVIIPAAVVPCLIAIYLVATAEPSGLITTGILFSAAPVIYWAVRAYNRRHGVDMHAFESVELTQALEQGRARPKSAPR